MPKQILYIYKYYERKNEHEHTWCPQVTESHGQVGQALPGLVAEERDKTLLRRVCLQIVLSP